MKRMADTTSVNLLVKQNFPIVSGPCSHVSERNDASAQILVVLRPTTEHNFKSQGLRAGHGLIALPPMLS